MTRSTRLHTELLHLARVAPSSLPILLHGETGCGKEVVAKAVHAMSHRAGRFVVFNAATCQEALLEAELFGHRRGAFTGAHRDRAGLIARAERGTLFLDEVAELRAPVQAAVLRFLDTGEVRAVGADEVGRGNARVVAASLRSLRHEVDRGRFRPDLYFRLAGAEVDLPPLRARPEDILPLARLFAGRRGVAAETLDDLLADGLGERLLAYPWPGNVRQLQHWVDQLAALLLAGASRRQIGQRLAHPLTILAGRAREGTAQQGARAGAMPGREELIRLLVLHRGNIARVAADLQTYRTRVYRWLRRRGIDYDTFRVTSPGSDRATSRRPDRQ